MPVLLKVVITKRFANCKRLKLVKAPTNNDVITVKIFVSAIK